MHSTRLFRDKNRRNLPNGYRDRRLRSDSGSPFDVITDIVSEASSKASSVASSVYSVIKAGKKYVKNVGRNLKFDKSFFHSKSNKSHGNGRRKPSLESFKDMPLLVAFDSAFVYCFENRRKYRKVRRNIRNIIANFANSKCKKMMINMLEKEHLALQRQQELKPLHFVLVCNDIYRSTCFNFKLFEDEIFSNFFKQVEIANHYFNIDEIYRKRNLENFGLKPEVSEEMNEILQNILENDEMDINLSSIGILHCLLIYRVFSDKRDVLIDFFDNEEIYLTATDESIIIFFNSVRARLVEILAYNNKQRIGELCSSEFEMIFTSTVEKLLELEEFLGEANNETCSISEALSKLDICFLFLKAIIKQGIVENLLTVAGCEEFLFKSYKQVELDIDSITISLVSVDYTAPVLCGPTIDLT